MSKIGKQPILIPSGVTVTVDAGAVVVESEKSERGKITIPLLPGVAVAVENGVLQCTLTGSGKQARSNWGTLRALIANAVVGLTKGFEKTLILEGVGYRITKEGEHLSMTIGFSHPVKYEAPPGIAFEVEKNSILKIKGIDRALVGQVAAGIRALKKPEPYKGKGFHYSDEVIKRKAGKKAGAAGGTAGAGA
ncbi:50S ribosomal protein L6 [Candidatus Jorgensenbacteria bacterium CG10_big_fil_rev_8_21_14_0_10_54_38]|uniref:Large ribosomal subunit protein uL6 n=2 Tax=Candidatus Joergenseniibacteriota TaxID=1752739 RepID=A0A2M6WGE5_9BACT|nr:MAG: 50S ribosomal protein L6 [Candidatus Jorgensenbacteria bacterium CG23_combo_of_CG06-09_8_20_14_all_54_14]PIT91837.1 MAG: 50S ribosomal protein L6 [Candidatus Jorgensenbacteria bacterium CG10_big_fil_rev_8_21_14_0_10_54_38]